MTFIFSDVQKQDPEDTVWEVECEKSSVVQFGDGGLAAKAFPGLLTVSLLTTEGLAMVDVRVRRYAEEGR